ncbi:MAG: tyrosine-type recombinase/integrase [Bacteroidetes bacterium]|nr:tyrosine-type recombinase/integrase [Bacteroidota bacterium]
MPRINRKLSDTELRNAKARDKDYKLYDEGGLRLLVRKTGTKVWQYPYKLYGKANVYTIGQYPQIGAAEARRMRDDVRLLVQKGLDPNKDKEERYWANMPDTELAFEKIAREWYSKQVWDKKHASNILRTLETDVFPKIGKKPINEVNAQDILRILRAIEERGALDVAKRVNQRCTAIFDYAIVKGICDNNPAMGRAKIIQNRKVKHRPHLSEEQLPEFLKAMDSYRGSKKVKFAMQFLMLTFVRPGELRNARWRDINKEKAEWQIPAEQMKMKRPHIVPLSTQALAILADLEKITGKSELLFPSSKNHNNPISDVTLTKVLIIMGYIGEKKVVPHGMRATASTILNEKGQFRPDVIERQLAHVEKNKVRAAYHHAEYLIERKQMMQWWGNYLNSVKDACH